MTHGILFQGFPAKTFHVGKFLKTFKPFLGSFRSFRALSLDNFLLSTNTFMKINEKYFVWRSSTGLRSSVEVFH